MLSSLKGKVQNLTKKNLNTYTLCLIKTCDHILDDKLN